MEPNIGLTFASCASMAALFPLTSIANLSSVIHCVTSGTDLVKLAPFIKQKTAIRYLVIRICIFRSY